MYVYDLLKTDMCISFIQMVKSRFVRLLAYKGIYEIDWLIYKIE